jgi:hypothetical protein
VAIHEVEEIAGVDVLLENSSLLVIVHRERRIAERMMDHMRASK